MDDGHAADRLIFKILSGLQSGVEVALLPGEYSVGSGDGDDIQLIDVTLKPDHLRLRLAPGKIKLAARSGAFRTVRGLSGEANDPGWKDLEPLDVVTAGTTRFALGAPSAQWTTVTDESIRPDPPKAATADTSRVWALSRWRDLIWPVFVGLSVLTLAGAISVSNGGLRLQAPSHDMDADLIRAAVAPLPFAGQIAVRQDVDGTIYVQGYVDSLVERRAVAEAIDKTGVPARVRLYVLQVLRSEIDGLIRAEKVNVTYAIAANGVVSLDGTILQVQVADRFLARLRENAIGAASIESHLKTAETYLSELERLKKSSGLDPSIVLRLDRETIEVNGVIATNKVDAWVGFLQAYSRRMGKEIGLRSFVQLQYDPGAPLVRKLEGTSAAPLIFNPQVSAETPNLLDAERLRRGDFEPSMLFAGVKGDAASGTSPSADKGPEQPTGGAGPASAPGPQAARAAASADREVAVPRAPIRLAESGVPPSGSPAASPVATAEAAARAERPEELRTIADHALGGWLTQSPPTNAEDQSVRAAIETVAKATLGKLRETAPVDAAARQTFVDTYKPLLATMRTAGPDTCRAGSHLTAANAGAALLWLDILSSTDAVTLDRFGLQAQGEILEAALNPAMLRRCLGHSPEGRAALSASLYLAEASRNPEFVQFVTRTLPVFALKVTGASLLEPRYVQTEAGEKLAEGAAPSDSSRIDVVGELGTAVQLSRGYARIIYGPGINWLSSSLR